MPFTRTVARLAGVALLWAASAQAQILPDRPVVLGDGRLTIGGDVSASFGSADPDYFNYTDYEHSALRLVRADLSAAFKMGDRLTALGELRTENGAAPTIYALYLRIHPWRTKAFDIQVGRVPPTFGAFSRRTYAADNPLVGYPLAYQYLTSLRPDAVPADADELLHMRGRGWLSQFSVGSTYPERGVPLASPFQWGTGVQAHAAGARIELTASVTTGTISNPLYRDDNADPQLAGRIVARPLMGLVIGASGSHGRYLAADLARLTSGGGRADRFTQDAWGVDVEYSRGYYVVRAETIVSRWTLPSMGTPTIGRPLAAVGTSIEGRYKIVPGLYAAARADHLTFSTVTGSNGPVPWDAPVTRFEVGGGYSLQRNLLLKIAYQFNRRDGTRVTTAQLPAAQMVFWF